MKKKLVSEVINLIQKIINKEIFFKRVTIMEEVLRFKWISIILSILNTDRFRQLNDNLDDIEDVIKYRILTYHTFTKQEKIFDLY